VKEAPSALPAKKEPSSALLGGNGALLVRERALAVAVQRALERLYQIDGIDDVGAFVTAALDGEREALLVREADDGALEMALRLPPLAQRSFEAANAAALDPLCQLIEGVSHFVYIADRVRDGREATHLELELQAEVDKYVVLAASIARLDPTTSALLRGRLYEDVLFTHDAESELGERYRIANELAGKFVRRLEQVYIAERRYDELRRELRRFYRMGQEDKLRVGRAA
jgi:hypothetical protein